MGDLRSNRQIEDAAIPYVLALEKAAGRSASDARGQDSVADIEGDRLIEVEAFGSSARGSDLCLETRQVRAAEDHPDTFHLVLVENVRQGDRRDFRVIDLSGAVLAEMLERKRERRYLEVPFPVAMYDAAVGKSD